MSGSSRQARKAAGHPTRDAPFNGEAVRRAGFILQAVLPDGERRWFLRQDAPFGAALREVCAVLDGCGGKVETICSPTTIWRDLQGTRSPERGQKAGQSQFTSPEAYALAKVGRMDLLV